MDKPKQEDALEKSTQKERGTHTDVLCGPDLEGSPLNLGIRSVTFRERESTQLGQDI